MLPVSIVYAVEYAAGARIVLNSTSLAGLGYVAIFPALLGYYLWNVGVSVIGAARAGAFMYLNPFFGSVLALAILNERFGLHHAIGMTLILAGVMIAQPRRLQAR